MKMPKEQIFQIALVVRDYDEAIDFYVKKLGFELVEDTVMSEEKRWVVVSPGENSCQLLLAKAANEHQLSRVGDQTGGRVFLFLHTDDIKHFEQRLRNEGIRILRGPVTEPFGEVIVFEDLYGNKWDLIQPIQSKN
jgi:catechol 2,3-dioxygenase-like lactoylglutathione lyase family enzyme